MSFGVGITTLKLARQPSTKASKRRTGKLGSVVQECCRERYSADPEKIDRARSRLNTYEGISRGEDLAVTMMEEADADSYQRQLEGRRGLRADAAIGFALIVKPEAEAVNSWSQAERDKFFQDSDAVLDTILNPKNMRAKIMHRDEEADHQHRIYMGYDDTGRINVDAVVNPTLWRKLNRDYVDQMREKGWDISYHDEYDAQKAAEDPQYRKDRIAKRKTYGRSASAYGAEKDAERIMAKAEQKAAELTNKENKLILRESRAKRKEKEQQAKAEEFQHKEDALEAQARALRAREQALDARERELIQRETQSKTVGRNRFAEAKDRFDSVFSNMPQSEGYEK